MTRSSAPALTDLHRGMNFGYLARRGYYGSPEARAQVDAMHASGVRWVALMVTIMQDTFASTRIYQDFEFTASDHELEGIVDYIHERGMHVMLKPVIECQDSSWRGRIHFPEHDQQIQGRLTDYWSPWFASLQASLKHYASFAQRAGIELLSVGCELEGTDTQTQRWSDTVRMTRDWYDGPLTAQVNDPVLVRNDTHLWMRELDLLSFSFYHPAARAVDDDLDAMKQVLEPEVVALRDLAKDYDLSIFFNEVGCRSLTGAALDPSDYRPEGAYDPDVQGRYLEAILSSFWDEPWWRGMYWWKWEEQQRRPYYYTDPAGDTGFTLGGKPGVEVLKRW